MEHSLWGLMPTTSPTSASLASYSWYQPFSSTTFCEQTMACYIRLYSVLCTLYIFKDVGCTYSPCRVSDVDPFEECLKKTCCNKYNIHTMSCIVSTVCLICFPGVVSQYRQTRSLIAKRKLPCSMMNHDYLLPHMYTQKNTEWNVTQNTCIVLVLYYLHR